MESFFGNGKEVTMNNRGPPQHNRMMVDVFFEQEHVDPHLVLKN